MSRNEDLKKEVMDELHWDNRIDSSKINVTVEDGIITLSGTVPTYYDLKNAVVAVWRISGIIQVINNLSISYVSPPMLPNDIEIKKRAEDIITWDPVIDETAINISVNSGIISLEGEVDAHWKLSNIENKISGIRGVLKIVNKLTVVPSIRLNDAMVEKDVVAAINRDILINGDEVDVKVDDGIVKLKGTVPNWVSKRAAEVDTSLTRGVVDIKNELEVNS